jgi:hypothetical protein
MCFRIQKGTEKKMGMTRLMKKDTKIYDGKRLWEAYTGMGLAASYKKLNKWAEVNGMTNPMTGKASQMGPACAMWRYALKNPDEAYPFYQKWAEEYRGFSDIEPTFENFLKEISHHARNTAVVAKGTYVKWCKQWELKPYDE